jgi:hypothetical protein
MSMYILIYIDIFHLHLSTCAHIYSNVAPKTKIPGYTPG